MYVFALYHAFTNVRKIPDYADGRRSDQTSRDAEKPTGKTRKLWTIAHALQNGLKADGMNIGITNSMVTPVYLSGSVAEGMQVVFDLRENYNIFCSIVVYPVIPKGQLLLRLIPTSMHTLEDVKYTIKAFKNVAEKTG